MQPFGRPMVSPSPPEKWTMCSGAILYANPVCEGADNLSTFAPPVVRSSLRNAACKTGNSVGTICSILNGWTLSVPSLRP